MIKNKTKAKKLINEKKIKRDEFRNQNMDTIKTIIRDDKDNTLSCQV